CIPRRGKLDPWCGNFLETLSRETDGIRSVRESHRRTIGRSIPEVADPGAQTVHNALLRIHYLVCVVHDENIRRLPRRPLPRHGARGSDGEISAYRIGVSREEHILIAAVRWRAGSWGAARRGTGISGVAPRRIKVRPRSDQTDVIAHICYIELEIVTRTRFECGHRMGLIKPS